MASPTADDTQLPPLVVASNRGPLSFTKDEAGNLVPKRGAGGLVATMAPGVSGTDALWVGLAMTEADREAASGVVEAEGFRVRTLVVDPATYAAYYDVVANATLWFLYHGLYDLARRPRIDRRWREAWEAYVSINDTFAAAIAADAPEGAVVAVQDYHLALVGRRLRQARPDLRAVHFSHTPFCGPTPIRVLPEPVATELVASMADYRACGFHTRRWADNFLLCCDELGVARPSTFVAPAAVDPTDAGKVAATEACDAEVAALDERFGDRKLIVRVDRFELSKNVLRGFLAFDDLLRQYPEHRGRVTFFARVYPSREDLPEYVAYQQEAQAIVNRVNDEWGTPDWTPIVLDVDDDFTRSVAALRRYDVLLVNPVRDGLNMVAKEGPLVNERAGVLALSREAGAHDEIGEYALTLNPFDVAGTADVLAAALAMPHDERTRRQEGIRGVVLARSPADWLAAQVRAAGA